MFKLKKYFFVLILTDTDGTLTASDAATVLQKVLNNSYTMPIEEKTKYPMEYLDTDGDYYLSAADSAMILQKVLVGNTVMPIEANAKTKAEQCGGYAVNQDITVFSY